MIIICRAIVNFINFIQQKVPIVLVYYIFNNNTLYLIIKKKFENIYSDQVGTQAWPGFQPNNGISQ